MKIILRVIAGSVKGRRLKTVKGTSTRPTSDRVKESLFNILSSFISDAEILDLFAGTGSLGIEALSRGAASVVFVEKDAAAFSVINQNLETVGLKDKSEIIKGDAFSIINDLAQKDRKFDIILLDPPYHKNLIIEALKYIEKSDIIKKDSVIAAERDAGDPVPDSEGRLFLAKDVKYGDTALSFYRILSDEEQNTK